MDKCSLCSNNVLSIYIYIIHLADAFIQNDLQFQINFYGKLYCTNHIFYRPRPTLPLTGNLLHFYFLKKKNKNLFCMIYTPFEIWGYGEMST